MRIPKINNYYNISDKELISLPSVEFSKPAYVMYDDKKRNKFIKTLERKIRSSLEYKEFIAYLRSGLEMNYCMFFNNVSKEKNRKIGIEIHHIPFTLYDICNIVLTKYEKEDLEINPFDISEEVMRLHYEGKVGLVPLSTTVHQLYHRGDIFIPLQYVDRGFLAFYHEYKPYLVEYVEMLNRLVNLSSKFDASSNNILQKHLIYLDTMGYNQKPQKIL